jgi:hypothetical protein
MSVLSFFGWNCNEETMGMGLSEDQEAAIISWAETAASRRNVSVDQLLRDVRMDIYLNQIND